MRVKIVRWPDPTSSRIALVVMRWTAGQWEPVMNFELNESERANEFALNLSMSKREPVEMVVFEDGEKLVPTPVFVPLERVESGPPELAYRTQKSENQSS